MKTLKVSLFAAILAVAAFSCKKADKSMQIAEATCACMKPGMDIATKQKAMLEAKDSLGLAGLMGELEKVNADAQKCMADMEAKFGKPDAELQTAVMESLKKACPDAAAVLGIN